MPIYRL